MGNLRRAFAAIHLKAESGSPVKPEDWKVTGPGHHAYKVTGFDQEINGAFKGRLTFTVQRDNADTLTLVGEVADDGAETIALNGNALPHPDIDGDLAAHTRIFPFQVWFSVIVNFIYDDANEPHNQGRFRMEANIGSTHIPGLP